MGIDRFSILPDELRAAIISKLPVKEAVRSSLLSRSWRHVWTAMTRLDLRSKKSSLIIRRIPKLMPDLNLAAINSLCLSLVCSVGPPPYLHEPLVGPPFGDVLEVLELSRSNFRSRIGIPFETCTNLKSLKLDFVNLGGHVLDTQVFPNCRFLQSLIISSSAIRPTILSPTSRLACFSTNASLKSLELHKVCFRGITKVSIKSLGLTNLTLDHLIVSYLNFDMSNSLFDLDSPEIITLRVLGRTFDFKKPCHSRNDYCLTSERVLELFTRHQNSRFPRLQNVFTDIDLKDTGNTALLCGFFKHCHQLKRLYITTLTDKEGKQGTTSDQYCRHCLFRLSDADVDAMPKSIQGKRLHKHYTRTATIHEECECKGLAT